MTEIAIRRLDARAPDFETELARLLARNRVGGDAGVTARVAEIIDAVRTRGDEALLEWTARLDDYRAADAADLAVSPADLDAALRRIAPPLRAALERAAARIADYHRRQMAGLSSWQFEDEYGSVLGERITPLATVGVYAPGGLAAYPSSVLMAAIPARVAGVGEIVVVSPAPGGDAPDVTMAAAALAGADRFFRIGGAQAIAALAFGTATIPRADKIVGPGGAFVSEAKRQVFGAVGIEMIAGPSEALIIADAETDPDRAAADLLAQAEHSADAQVILLATDAAFLQAAAEAAARLLRRAPRREIIQAALAERGGLIEAPDLSAACRIADAIAPEHLQVMTADAAAVAAKIANAGAVFIGADACVALGDYCAGASHVLPTGGGARFASPLGAADFVKRGSFLRASAKGAAALAETARILALGEGFHAHAESAQRRRKE